MPRRRPARRVRAGRATVVEVQPGVFGIVRRVRLSLVPEPVVIAPEGELDLHSVDALAPQLDEAAGADYPHLILDLSAVTLVDSTALGAIAQVQHRFNGRGRKLSVVAPPGSAAAVLLELSRLRSRLVLPAGSSLLIGCRSHNSAGESWWRWRRRSRSRSPRRSASSWSVGRRVTRCRIRSCSGPRWCSTRPTGCRNVEIAARLDSVPEVDRAVAKSFRTASGWRVLRIERGRVARAVFPPQQVAQVKAIACELPREPGVPLSRFSRAELHRLVIERAVVRGVGVDDRALALEDAIKPWQHRSWIFPRDPRFLEKAGPVLDLYERRWQGELLQPGRLRDLRRREDPDPGAPARLTDDGAAGARPRAARRARLRPRRRALLPGRLGRPPRPADRTLRATDRDRAVRTPRRAGHDHRALRARDGACSGSSTTAPRTAARWRPTACTPQWPNLVLVHLPFYASLAEPDRDRLLGHPAQGPRPPTTSPACRPSSTASTTSSTTTTRSPSRSSGPSPAHEPRRTHRPPRPVRRRAVAPARRDRTYGGHHLGLRDVPEEAGRRIQGGVPALAASRRIVLAVRLPQRGVGMSGASVADDVVGPEGAGLLGDHDGRVRRGAEVRAPKKLVRDRRARAGRARRRRRRAPRLADPARARS